MTERELPRKPIPDILTKPFVEGIHPYTMMFLGLAYQEGAFKGFSKRQLEVFDRYYIDGLTIEGQYDYRTRGNLSTLIKMGFETLRRNVSDKVNEAFPDRLLPYFKKKDLPFVSNMKQEKNKYWHANASLGKKMANISDEARAIISERKKEDWKKRSYRLKVKEGQKRAFADPEVKKRRSKASKIRTVAKTQAVNELNSRPFSQERRKKIASASKRNWEDLNYREKVKEGRRRARERRLAEQATIKE